MSHHIHDKFFKQVFSETDNIKDFLTMALPKELKEEIDWNFLTLDTTSYVSEELEDYFSDVVAHTRLKEKHHNVDIYFLFEHKSYYDKGVLLQLLQYMLLMWQRDSKEKKPLRVIIPLVFYHGQKKWDIPREFKDLFPVKESLKHYLLNFRYLLVDTLNRDFQEVKPNAYLWSALLLMKTVFSQDFKLIAQVLDRCIETGLIHNDRVFIILFSYILETKDVEEVKHYLEERKRNELMATFVEKIRQEGEIKGKMEGKMEGEIKGKIDTLHHAICDAIKVKFGKTPKEMKASITTIQDEKKLKELHRAVILANRLDEVKSNL